MRSSHDRGGQRGSGKAWALVLPAESFCRLPLAVEAQGPSPSPEAQLHQEFFRLARSQYYLGLFKSPLAFPPGTPQTHLEIVELDHLKEALLSHPLQFGIWSFCKLRKGHQDVYCLSTLVVMEPFLPLHFRQLKQTDFPTWETILVLELSNAILCAGRGRGKWLWEAGMVVVAAALVLLSSDFILAAAGEI